MVYRGKPSTGCRNCRQRHIKCDETRPHCKACTRTNRHCPGYLDSFDLMLRDHTALFKKSSTPASSRSSNKSPPSKDGYSPNSVSSQALSTTSSRNLISAWPPPIAPADLYQPMEHTVIPLWFNSYLYLPQDIHIRNGFMDVLPSLYAKVKTGSHLHLSTLAVGFFTLAAWTGQASLLKEAEQYFARALPKLRQALQENADGDFENLLISILLLSEYEDFMATKLWENPMKAHLKGAVALLNDRKSKSSESPVSPFLEHTVQTQIIKSSRGMSGQTVQTPQVWPLAQPVERPSPKSLLSSITTGIVHLRSAWENMLLHPPDEIQAAAILKKAIEVDINLVSWTYRVPAHWKPATASIIPQPVRDAGIWKNRCDCYPDIWITANMNTSRDCRILVHNIMLGCIRLLPSADPDGSQASTLQSTIVRLADDICASVPFVLGSQRESVRMKPGNIVYPFAETRPVTSTHIQAAPLHGAWQLFTPLRNLQNPDLGLPPEQVTWAREQMERVLTIYFQR